jgi:hypothetical protein
MGTWEPGVVYLLGLIAAELVLMAVLRTMTRHGG